MHISSMNSSHLFGKINNLDILTLINQNHFNLFSDYENQYAYLAA